MSVRHPKQEKIEKNMRLMCNALDAYLEDKYQDAYPLHPNRAERGKLEVFPTTAYLVLEQNSH